MVSLADITVSNGFVDSEVEKTLSRYGAAVLPGWIKDQELEKLRQEWDDIWSKRKDKSAPYVHHVGGDVADYASLDREASEAKQFEAVNGVFEHPKIVRLAELVVGQPCKMNSAVYATYDLGKGAEVAPSHFDKLWNLKFMIYLEDILEKGRGAFGVHPGSTPLARRQFREWFSSVAEDGAITVGAPEYYTMNNEILPEDLPPFVEILAPAGTLIIFSTDVFHRGSYLESGRERRIFRAHTAPADQVLRSGTKITMQSAQWHRGEEWETGGKELPQPPASDGSVAEDEKSPSRSIRGVRSLLAAGRSSLERIIGTRT